MVSVVFWLDGPFEVEEDGDVAVGTEGFAERIEHWFAGLRKTTEDENHFAGDGVNDLADLVVVQHEVEELGDFEIVHGDFGFIKWRYANIGLGSAIEGDVPDRGSVDTAA